MIYNERGTLVCRKCGYSVSAVYGSGMRGYPGERTLKADILAGKKGKEAKAVLEKYPDAITKLTSHFYRCPSCQKLSSHIRIIIYKDVLWANDVNYYTSKTYCSDCGDELEEISYENVFSLRCPSCNHGMETKNWVLWD